MDFSFDCVNYRRQTPAELNVSHVNSWWRLEPDLFEIHTKPDFAIGQRALLIRTPQGNFLWDCIALIDDATVELIKGVGGLAGIAISHGLDPTLTLVANSVAG